MTWGRYRVYVAVEVEADDAATAIAVVEDELRDRSLRTRVNPGLTA